MRVVTVCNIMSLDGFYEDPSGNPLALNMDHAFDAYNLERIRAAACSGSTSVRNPIRPTLTPSTGHP